MGGSDQRKLRQLSYKKLETAISFLKHEIKQREIVEQEFRENNQKLLQLAAIVESSHDAIISGTLEGLILNWNKGAENMFGYSCDEVKGQSVYLLFPAERKYEEQKIIQIISSGESIKNLETVCIGKDGQYVDVSLSVFPVKGANQEISGFAEICRDITERKRHEKEVARLGKLNLVGQMAAGIGHEIRNPMTTIKGFLQILSQKEEYAKDYEYFKLMIEELNRANSIISEFLSLTQDKEVNLQENNLNEILNAIFPLLLADAIKADKNIEFLQGNISPLLLDEKEIRQLIYNLVRNGLEAMSSGGKLTLKTYMEEDHILLEVKDEGAGIDPETLEKLGTPFFSTKENGTGLGLAICYSIANRHQASINVKSSPQGTSFFVRFKC